MSLETGKKLGLTASLIFVIVPVIAVVLLISTIISIIETIPLNGTLPSNTGAFGLLGIGVSLTLVILALLSLVGLILLIIAMYSLSRYYNTPGIFTNILYAIIINIVSAVVIFALDFALLIPATRSISISGTTPTPGNLFGDIFTGLIAVGVAAIILTIISSVLVMRSFNLLGEKSEVDGFKTVGLLYFIGTLLAIILVGAIIAWIAFILAAISFNRLKPLPPTSVPVTYPPQVPPSTAFQTKRCPYCQTENRMDATYCRFCGKPLT